MALAGCGATDAPRLSKGEAATTTEKSCPAAWQRSWQKLANRIDAPVYCPSWLPDPLDGQIGGRWNNIDSVGKDRSYLVGFVWQEMSAAGDPHQPPRLSGGDEDPDLPLGRARRRQAARDEVPCFDDSHGQKTIGGFRVHRVHGQPGRRPVARALRLAARRVAVHRSAQHVAPPLTFPMVVRNLNRELASLVLVEPQQ